MQDKLLVLCHAVNGDGSVNAYIGPDTPGVRRALDKLKAKHSHGMFEIGCDGPPGQCDNPLEFIKTLDWWGEGCPDDHKLDDGISAELVDVDVPSVTWDAGTFAPGSKF